MKPTDGLREIVPVERWTVCLRAIDTPSAIFMAHNQSRLAGIE